MIPLKLKDLFALQQTDIRIDGHTDTWTSGQAQFASSVEADSEYTYECILYGVGDISKGALQSSSQNK